VNRGAILLATRSAGKLRELKPIFEHAGLAVIDLVTAGIAESPQEHVVERFDTFEENALAKARYFCGLSGHPVVADDSGLEVLALEGAPGVRSRRWSRRDDLSGPALDAANNAVLVGALTGATDRRARYVCVAAYRDGAREFTVRGETHGLIVHEARGAHGFGYDPHFFSPEIGCTFGESSRDEKERVSHRGRAMRALLARLAAPS